MLKISVGDVDEPPVFTLPSYVMDVHENAKIGTVVGTVTAQDPDSANNVVRYGALIFFFSFYLHGLFHYT